MSAIFTYTDGDALVWSTNLPNVEAFTAFLWFKPTLGTGTQPNIMSLGIAAGEGRAAYINASDQWTVWDGVGANNGGSVTGGSWAILCLRGNGTQLKLFWKLEGGGSWNTITATQTTGIAEDLLALGRWIGGSDFANGSARAFKQWNVALSDAEVDAEALQLNPVRTTNLQRFIPLTTGTDTNDASGNGFNPTIEGGGLGTDADNPTTPATGSVTIVVDRASIVIAGRDVTLTPPTPQKLRPDADIMQGTWVPSSGSPFELWQMIDETSPDDSDYIYTDSNAECEVSLNAGTDPGTNEGHVMRVRLAGNDAATIVVTLKQGGSGGTTIATRTVTPAPSSPTTYEWPLTALEAAAITDYTNLAINIQASR